MTTDQDAIRRGLTPAEITAFIERHFANVHEGSGRLEIESAGEGRAVVRMRHDINMIRPGGTVSGPAMFKLADFSIYVAILAIRGTAAVEAVTATMTMNFLSRPAPGDIVAHARLIKLGRRLAVGEVELFSPGSEAMVAQATATYSMPAGYEVK